MAKVSKDAVARLRKLRLVPRQVIEYLEGDMDAMLARARTDAEGARAAHPEYLEHVLFNLGHTLLP